MFMPIKNILILLVVGLSLVAGVYAVRAGEDFSLAVVEPALSEDGTLLKIKGLKGAAVYEVGPDGKKYVFTDEKTYKTWRDDFKQVKEVSQSQLDSIPDGGMVAIQPGSKLLTHQNTAKVFVVGSGNVLYHIADEQTARKFFGSRWSSLVVDIDSGVFAAAYKNYGDTLAENNLPDGVLVQEEGKDEIFLIENKKKRDVKPYAYGENGLYRKTVLKVKTIPESYGKGEALKINEKTISNYNPVPNKEGVVICHDPDNSIGRRGTIKIAPEALAVHLAHGDTEGACDASTPPEPVPITCNNLSSEIKKPLGGDYWKKLGLETTANKNILRYRILLDSGQWSPWYTPGVNDVDWADSGRRVWAYFDDHSYQMERCQPVSDHTSDVSCPNSVAPVLEIRSRTNNYYWADLLLDTAKHPEIKKYKIRWPSGAWSAEWYYPGKDLDPANSDRRMWALFDSHEHKVVYCPNLLLNSQEQATSTRPLY